MKTLRVDARGNRTTYSFDAVDQQTGRLYLDGSRATFVYDEVGNRTLMQDSTGSFTYTYDAREQRTSAVGPVTINGFSPSYGYDARGQRQTMQIGPLDPITYSYDAAGQLRGLQSQQGPTLHRFTFNYDAAGRRTLKELSNDTRASTTYDAAGLICSTRADERRVLRVAMRGGEASNGYG